MKVICQENLANYLANIVHRFLEIHFKNSHVYTLEFASIILYKSLTRAALAFSESL